MALPTFTSIHEANSFAKRLIAAYKNNIISEKDYQIACVEVLQRYTALKMTQVKQKIKPFTQRKSRLHNMTK